MSTEYYPATSYIGGGAGALDAIPCATLGTGEIAVVANATVFSVHYYDAASAAAESSPDVIKPDDNAGNGRWLIVVSIVTGGQIAFPATAVPSADANTLDDYEEGTWTPIFVSTGCTFTYTDQAGWYRKIGNLVVAQFHLLASAADTITNLLYLGGLPFTQSAGAFSYGSAGLGLSTFIAYPSSTGRLNDTIASLFQQGTTTILTPTTAGLNAGNKYLVGFFIYII